ncbi:hypothetical protein BC826DRAFT_654917 [Russula brevipes]|nr:hypothetical protein BC826DRAFT_654917 [Russula brevipes]
MTQRTAKSRDTVWHTHWYISTIALQDRSPYGLHVLDKGGEVSSEMLLLPPTSQVRPQLPFPCFFPFSLTLLQPSPGLTRSARLFRAPSLHSQPPPARFSSVCLPSFLFLSCFPVFPVCALPPCLRYCLMYDYCLVVSCTFTASWCHCPCASFRRLSSSLLCTVWAVPVCCSIPLPSFQGCPSSAVKINECSTGRAPRAALPALLLA